MGRKNRARTLPTPRQAPPAPRALKRRTRLVLVVALLVVIGLAFYLIASETWASSLHAAATQALARYDYRLASTYLERYLAFHPGDPTAHLVAAQLARRLADFDGAVRQLELAEKTGAQPEALNTERQLLKIHAGDLTEAPRFAQYCKDHLQGPETKLVLETLIEGSLRAINPPLARWATEQWLQRETGNLDRAQGLVWLGRVKELSQELPQAVLDFRQAVELAPEHAEARLRLTEALIREEPRDAVAHLEWLREHSPDDPEVRFLAARLQRNLGQPEEARRLLDEILMATPDRVAVLVERGRVALDLHQPEQAEPPLRRALALAPEARDVHLALSDCLRQAGRLEEAQRHQQRAQELEAQLSKKLDELLRKAQP